LESHNSIKSSTVFKTLLFTFYSNFIDSIDSITFRLARAEIFHVVDGKKVTKETEKGHQVGDLEIEEETGVTVGKNCDYAVTEDQDELHHLGEGQDGFDEVQSCSGLREGAQEVVDVHQDVYEGVDQGAISSHQPYNRNMK
jgi:hypothetical protein